MGSWGKISGWQKRGTAYLHPLSQGRWQACHQPKLGEGEAVPLNAV